MADLLLLLHEKDTTPGTTTEWCQSRSVTYDVRVASDLDPSLSAHDYLGAVVFGGDMQVWQEERFPWLKTEKNFLQSLLTAHKKIFGLCLGTQLLAQQLGERVVRMGQWELGWYPVKLTESGGTLVPLHWHSSSYTMPPRAVRLAETTLCKDQGFRLSEKILGYQFHAEIDERRLAIALSGWRPGREGRVQSAEEIKARAHEFMPPLKEWYFRQLDLWWKAS